MRLTEQNGFRGCLHRACLYGFVALFAVAGAPNLAMTGLASTSRTEHETKPPVVEEEHRAQTAISESPQRRLVRDHRSTALASTSIHTPERGKRLPTRLDVVQRRVLDKQNGLGAFLLC